jgi:hypothetical protein
MKIAIMLIALWVFCIPIFSQDNDSSYKYWMTLGIMPLFNDVSVSFSYNFSIKDNFYKIGYQKKGNSITEGLGHMFNTIDISYGKRIISEWIFADFFIGPSYIYGEKLAAKNRENFKTAGLQADTQLLFRMANEIGIGFGLYGNLNFERSYTGFSLYFTIGNGK